MVKIALNGFGRTARSTFRAYLLHHREKAQIVAINTSGSMIPQVGLTYYSTTPPKAFSPNQLLL
ncbi:MAG: hypothetical protein AAB538_00105, partial [Patescibacteria group bacterium]